MNEEKSRILVKTFFPTKRTANEEEMRNVEDLEEVDTPGPICKMSKLTRDQITRHLAKLKPYKAPGPDGIPNIVLTKCADLLIDRLYYIYNAMVKRDLFYEPWKKFTTIVLRKPGKPKYNVPKAYRPIALINTLVKVLTAVLAEQLMYYAEHHHLLPANHFGGRKGRNATDAVQTLTHRIKKAWRKGEVISVLFLDIEGAFPNANNERLISNLKKRRIPRVLISFIANMLKDRTTVLKFDGYTSEAIILNNGIGQGDPLSMALYQFYNADLLDIPEGPDEGAIAYVDDAILLASGTNFHSTHEKLSKMMTRENGAIKWAEKHNSHFEYSKLVLIDFAHQNKKIDRPTLTLPNVVVNPSKSTKYLGVYLNQNLLDKEQLAYIIGKGTTWAAQIKRVTRPSWGLTPKAARKLYVGVALPRILYGIETWSHPPRTETPSSRNKPGTIATRKLATTQRAGALAITGGFRTSPTDALNAHVALLPMHLRLDKVRFTKAIRLASLAGEHPLYKQTKTAFRRRVKRHKSSIDILASLLESDPDGMETIPAFRIDPALRRRNTVQVSIPSDKEASRSEDRSGGEEIKVYSDGSLHNGKVGAAAVLYRKGKRKKSLRIKLGSAMEHTIFEAELVGLILALQLIKTEKRGKVSCAIGTDSQAAVKALHSELTKPGQHLAAEFLAIANKLALSRSGSTYSLTIRWTAGHVGIKGNEQADKEAKMAANGDTTQNEALPKCIRKKIKQSTSAVKQKRNKAINSIWKEEWNESPRFKCFRATDLISPSSKKYMTLISDHRISRHMASIIFQLRVGHAPLNKYLFRIGKVDSAHCPACGTDEETVEHFMLRCPKYAHERWALFRHIRDNAPRLEEVLSNPKAIIPTTNYIQATERFAAKTQMQAQQQ